MTRQLDWQRGGLLLGLAFLLAIVLVKPIGVATQFVIAAGILWKLGDSQLCASRSRLSTGSARGNRLGTHSP